MTSFGNVNALPASAKTALAPTLAEYNGDLWCVWVQKTTNELSYSRMNLITETWDTPSLVSGAGLQQFTSISSPAITEFAGELHLVYRSDTGDLIHLRWDATQGRWVGRSAIPGSQTGGTPGLARFRNELFCVYRKGDTNQLVYNTYSISGWSNQTSTGVKSWGEPGPYMIHDSLRLLYTDPDNNRVLRELQYDPNGRDWLASRPPAEASQFGLTVAASSGAGRAICAFQINVDSAHSYSGGILVCDQVAGVWNKNIPTPNEFRSVSTPALATAGNAVYMVWNARGDVGLVEQGLYWSKRPLVTGQASLSLESWMSFLPDSLTLAQVSIPGTHDSGARGYVPIACTQTSTITEQLERGIRYFDLRGSLDSDTTKPLDARLLIVHGNCRFFWWSTFKEIMDDIYSFLRARPSEVVIVQIKQDRVDNNNQQEFADAVGQLVNLAPATWELGGTLQSLQAMRSSQRRIHLFRRFPLPTGRSTFGVDVTQWWPDNSSNISIRTTPGLTLFIQDEYDPKLPVTPPQYLQDIVRYKMSLVESHCQKAINNASSDQFYLNFASGVRFPGVSPKQLATGGGVMDGVNHKLSSFVAGTGATPPKRCLGTVALDSHDSPEDLVLGIIRSNTGVP